MMTILIVERIFIKNKIKTNKRKKMKIHEKKFLYHSLLIQLVIGHKNIGENIH